MSLTWLKRLWRGVFPPALLPPPDRSTLRNPEIIDAHQRHWARIRRQG